MMMRRASQVTIILLALAAALLPAQAQIGMLPELRAGLFARGTDDAGSLLSPERISDANVELLFNAPEINKWSIIGELRPHIGATVSFRDRPSYGYAGLSWTLQAPILPVFAEASIGAVARTSLFSAPEGDPARQFGCGVGARLSASLGINLPAGATLLGTLEHLPDFGTCGTPARDKTSLGVRLGLRF